MDHQETYKWLCDWGNDHHAECMDVAECDERINEDPDTAGKRNFSKVLVMIYKKSTNKAKHTKDHSVTELVEECTKRGSKEDRNNLLQCRCIASNLRCWASGSCDDVRTETIESSNDTSLEDLRAYNEPEESRYSLKRLGVGEGTTFVLPCSRAFFSSRDTGPGREVVERPPDVYSVLEEVHETNDSGDPEGPTPETGSVSHRDSSSFRQKYYTFTWIG